MKKLVAILFFAAFAAMGITSAQNYDNAVGLRGGWGVGGTFKHFLGETSAVEGIVRYRNIGSVAGFKYNFIQITGLYEVHAPLDDVLSGLQWYYGGGAFFGHYGGDYNGLVDGGQTYFGIAGAIGLDYAFESIPLNVSLDWIPGFSLGGGGFGAGNGGIAIRYIF